MTKAVCHVWDSEYPWDVRVEKVSRALTDAGYDVHLTARNREGATVLEVLPEASVHRLSPTPLLGKRLESAAMFPAFFNPRWIRLVHRTVVESKAQVILARDLPLAPTAIWVGRRLGLPVIHDMAENYGAMIRDLWQTGSNKFGDAFVRNPTLVDAVERWCLARLDHVVVVVEESRDRVAGVGFPRERITVASNTPPLSRLSRRIDRPPNRSALHVVYLGLMERARGVGLAIEAAVICRDRGIPVHLDLIGDGRELDAFKSEAKAAGLGSEEVRFHGFIQYQKALALVEQADAGLIPHYVNESWNTTIPNKLYDYMAAGVAVVASDAIPVVRVVNGTEAGLLFKDRDAESLAATFAELHELGDGIARFGEAGQRAVRERYNWEADSARLIRAVEGVIRDKGRNRTLP